MVSPPPRPRGGSAKVCERLLAESLAAVQSVTRVVRKHAELPLEGLAGTMNRCRAALSRVVDPALAASFLGDTGFQSWTLVLFELLSLVRWKLQHCERNGTLELTLRGARLRQFVDGLEAKVTAHVDLLEPRIEAVERCVEDLKEPGDHAAFHAAVGRVLQQDGGVLRVHHLVNDEEGAEWWTTRFGGTKYAVPWSDFEAALAEHEDPLIGKLLSADGFLAIFRRTLSPEVRKAVTCLQWGQFLLSYGPGIRVAIVQLTASSSNAPWFAGALSYDEARSVLAPLPCGTFLVRFSESSACTWAVSYGNRATGCVNHALIQAVSKDEKDAAPGEECSYFECGQNRYSSFEELIVQHHDQLRHPAPNVRNMGPARYFRDFLTYEQTVHMLERQRVGTFLLRFSQTRQGVLVVAYVAEGNGAPQVLQSKIYCDPSRGFILGGQAYPRIPDMIRENSDKLRYPLAVDFGATPEQQRQEDAAADETAHIKAASNSRFNTYGSLHPDIGVGLESTYLPLGELAAATQWSGSGSVLYPGPYDAPGSGAPSFSSGTSDFLAYSALPSDTDGSKAHVLSGVYGPVP